MDRFEELLAELDEDQRRAVSHGEGPLLVVAGAGSGKTRVLTYRIAGLLARGLARPHEILAVTFTNKAAREMVGRVEGLLGGRLSGGFVGTFHRFALQILRTHPREAGLTERFAIADEDDQRHAIERAMKEVGIGDGQLKPRTARSRISAWKNALVMPAEAEAKAFGHGDRRLALVYAAYEHELRVARAIDFDDMLLATVRMLEREPALARGLRERFRFILVDEYQDTNQAQARLIRLIGGDTPNLTAVGDEDQSIYRWRGAEVANILEFEDAYPGATVVTLGNNYRSREPIVRAAAAVIAHNTGRRIKRLESRAGDGAPIVLYQAADDLDEARFVADAIQNLDAEHGFGEMAVLFRTNAQSRPFEAELVRRGVPYVVVGGTRFWDRAEVKDAVAWLRLLIAPDDVLAFRRAIHVPARGIGEAAMEILEDEARSKDEPLSAAARRVPERLQPRARRSLEDFFAILAAVRGLLADVQPGEIVRALLERSGLAAQYGSGDEEDRARLANLDQLVGAAAEAGERDLDLAGFLDEVALLASSDVRTDGRAVQLSTLHAAKGLEWDVVFLVGMDDGLLPLRREGFSNEDEEEERRLAYVGMTRARRLLHLVSANVRRVNGQQLGGRPSPFLLAVPHELVEDRSPQAGRDSFRFRAAPTGRFPAATSSMAPFMARPSQREAKVDAPSSSKHPDGWRPGLKVRHATFGSGVILQIQGTGAQIRLVVYFDRAGRKTLVPSIAHLERA